MPEIIPVLLTLLTKQEEDADEDEWNVSMAAGTCLSLLAGAVQDNIVSAVIPFIEGNIKSEDWHHREAAVMAFGSILEGPDPSVLTPLVNQALPLLIAMMADSNLQVKDTTAWTLGRICDTLIETIKPDVHLHPLIEALANGLRDNPRIVTNCCWALMNLAEQTSLMFDPEDPTQSNPLSKYYEPIMAALLQVTERCVVACFNILFLSLMGCLRIVEATKPTLGLRHMKRLSHMFRQLPTTLFLSFKILSLPFSSGWNTLFRFT